MYFPCVFYFYCLYRSIPAQYKLTTCFTDIWLISDTIIGMLLVVNFIFYSSVVIKKWCMKTKQKNAIIYLNYALNNRLSITCSRI